jgi:transposase
VAGVSSVPARDRQRWARILKLWVRRKRGNTALICSGCGSKARKIEEVRQGEVRDLPWRKYKAVVYVECYLVRCPKCGSKVEEVPQLPSKAPFRKDFEDAVGLACESAPARRVARQFGLRPKNRIRRLSQSRLISWPSHILVQSRF